MWNVGPTELIIILVVVLIIFGPKNLPRIGQALGRGLREFKDASRGITHLDEDEPPSHQIPTNSNVSAPPQLNNRSSSTESQQNQKTTNNTYSQEKPEEEK